MEDGPLEDHQVVFVRPDPPFDIEYVKLTWLLDAVDRKRTFILNEPAGIRGASEKLYTLRFPELCPRTLITRDVPRLRAFLDALGGRMVVKPVDLMGGYGVFVVDASDANRNAILETSTRDGKDLVVAQAYLPEAREGDKRIIVLDGEPIGATLRVPAPGEHRGNIHVGATTEHAELTEADLHICETLAPHLQRGRPLLRGPRRHRRQAHRGERHQPHRGPGDRPPERPETRSPGPRLRRGPGSLRS